jgi:RNA polymerase sigma-70 factor (sigma-E family)
VDAIARDAFAAFVRASELRLTRLAVLLTGRRADAEDLVQTAYERTLRHWPQLSRDGDPDAYARRVLVNLVVDGARAGRRRPEVLREQVPEQVSPDLTAGVPDRLRVLAALAALPPAQRAAVVLRVHEDLSERQAADLLGCSVGTVKSALSRGTARLRELLVQHDEEVGR